MKVAAEKLAHSLQVVSKWLRGRTRHVNTVVGDAFADSRVAAERAVTERHRVEQMGTGGEPKKYGETRGWMEHAMV
jgi:hypothetical protein